MSPPVWKSWHSRLKAMKGRMPDVEIASAVEETLQATVRADYSVKRGLVNHWLNGRRSPNLEEFFALCQAIGADPGEVLFGERALHNYVAAHTDTARALRTVAAEPAQAYSSTRKISEFKAKRRRTRKVVLR